MPKCKDCIHYTICIAKNPLVKIEYCYQFKNKADFVEVKHGEWIPVTYTYFGLKRYECSECKNDEYWQKRYIEHKEKFCPNCGADMRGCKNDL